MGRFPTVREMWRILTAPDNCVSHIVKLELFCFFNAKIPNAISKTLCFVEVSA